MGDSRTRAWIRVLFRSHTDGDSRPHRPAPQYRQKRTSPARPGGKGVEPDPGRRRPRVLRTRRKYRCYSRNREGRGAATFHPAWQSAATR